MRDPGGLKFHPHNVSFSTFLDGEKENSLGWIPPMWPSLKHVLGDLDSIMILHYSKWFPKTYFSELPLRHPHLFSNLLLSLFSTFVIFTMIITPTMINVNGSLCESDIGKVPPYNSTTRGFLVFLVFSTINIICVRNFTWFDVRNMDSVYMLYCVET